MRFTVITILARRSSRPPGVEALGPGCLEGGRAEAARPSSCRWGRDAPIEAERGGSEGSGCLTDASSGVPSVPVSSSSSC